MIPSLLLYESDFGVTKITGMPQEVLVKPDYMKQRRKYYTWKKHMEARDTITRSLDELSQAVWIIGGVLSEIKIS